MKDSLDAVNFHFSIPVVDAHCDTLTVLGKQGRKLGVRSDIGHVDLPRLIAGGVNVQFFASFIGPEYKENPLARAMEIFDLFHKEMAVNSSIIEPAYNCADIKRILLKSKIAALLTLEGGEALAGRLEILRIFYLIGVRSITLTWNGRNELADGVLEADTTGGLTIFGREVVREMNRLGMVVDVSHLAPRGFWDVLNESDKPILATHSNCKSLCGHPRNLDDGQIKALSDSGGVMGLCFYPQFVHHRFPTLDYWFNHVEYIANISGVDCIGIGSDFDGINEVIPNLFDAKSFPIITEGLLKRGFSKLEVKKIMGGNILRVLEQVI